jgi:tetratricopeptide (TPR) repeat protein
VPRIRYLAACVLVALLAAPVAAQLAPVDSAQRLIRVAVAANTSAALDVPIAFLAHALETTPDDAALLHYAGYAWYREASLLAADGHKREAGRALDEAEHALEASEKTLDWPETLALRASVLGQRIGLSGNPLTPMRLGPRSDRLMDAAVKRDSTNPRVWLLRGIGSWHRPRLFGGGTERAERELRRAIELFDADHPATPAPAWGRAEAHAWLGVVLAKGKHVPEARASYDAALAIEPDNQWVSRVLLPALDSAAHR